MINSYQARVWSRPTTPWSELPLGRGSPSPSASTTASTVADDLLSCRGFETARQKAELEGLNIHATAPSPTFVETVGHRLQPPHGTSSGMVQSHLDSRRFDTTLTKDYFGRPAWNRSVHIEKDPNEDARTLETMARQAREATMEAYLRSSIQKNHCSRIRVSDDSQLDIAESIDELPVALGFTSMSKVSAAVSDAAVVAAAVRKQLRSPSRADQQEPVTSRHCGSPMCKTIKALDAHVWSVAPRPPSRAASQAQSRPQSRAQSRLRPHSVFSHQSDSEYSGHFSSRVARELRDASSTPMGKRLEMRRDSYIR